MRMYEVQFSSPASGTKKSIVLAMSKAEAQVRLRKSISAQNNEAEELIQIHFVDIVNGFVYLI